MLRGRICRERRTRPGLWPCTSPRIAVGPKNARGPRGPAGLCHPSHQHAGARRQGGRLSLSWEKFLLRPLSSLIRLQDLSHWRLTQRDAGEAARAAISGRASGVGKTKDGPVEAIRVLVVAKRSARQARVKAIVQMRHLGFTAPDQLHSRLKGLSVTALVAEGAKLRATKSADTVTAATKASLSSLAHRIQGLDLEIAELDEKIESLLLATAPDLMARFGVGPDTAASLLVAAGDNPERLHSEAAWAHLCGVSPVPADSGKNAGHLRRHTGGDRQANSALWRIAMVRIAHDPETTQYFER